MFRRKKSDEMRKQKWNTSGLVNVVDESELRQVVTGAGSDDIYIETVPAAIAAFLPNQIVAHSNTYPNPMIMPPKYR
ncbi:MULTISPECIES: hypothetical protein [Bacillus]|uniref:hypothetical protein n=1 Tax=Bacillus TaxID=1386 RepID=UPI000363365D|nr:MULTISPECIES: hypothetical protein [Bacillus]PEP56488.1 hypothetical protein CN564_17090 [Bacillus pseudomycoides]PGR94510.1 hypothetical protein COC54_27265 [Bacillus pseudomycoides]PHC82936.1 hypothetical protein COF36_25400 [Bacillus pseudomycoides]